VPPPEAEIETQAEAATEPSPEPATDYVDVVTKAGQQARGLYVPGPYIRLRGIRGLMRKMRQANLNAVVLDIKDETGRIGYQTNVEELKVQSKNFIKNPKQLISRLKKNGIYTIGRITCFADPQFPKRFPDRAIQDNRLYRKGQLWTSWGTGGHWLDPYNQENHDMILALATEAAGLGLDELQLDYIRFPVDAGTKLALYPSNDGRERWQVLLGLLRRIDAAITIPLGVDVFGLTAFRPDRYESLGQHLSEWTPHVEVFSPMLYLNAMRDWARGTPNRDYALVHRGISQLRQRLGPEPILRPFLQSFARGSDHYTPRFIANQIRATRDGGGDGFLFWHPGGNYQMLFHGALGPGRGLFPFAMDGRWDVRQARWRRGTDPVGPRGSSK
jgi:hypothetical protein